eukprot:CAMPEP_0172510304 /NCGR_PEP_ID=MMETSP1066-20121228/227726_1 /TAXON_ID=671091 /ORGANISM="Coscinodiscus wailesii, Strain CCMP2513" /LENGTH=227 /DNA_ID=CAMNT_0013289207 /DNA_START=54 /DNA_END=737 /DNA_ORIENTATION=+
MSMWNKHADHALSLPKAHDENTAFSRPHNKTKFLHNTQIHQQIKLRDFEANLKQKRKNQLSPSPCSVLSLASVYETQLDNASYEKVRTDKCLASCLKIDRIDKGKHLGSSPSPSNSLKHKSDNILKRKVYFNDQHDVKYFEKKPCEKVNENWLSALEIEGNKLDEARKESDSDGANFRNTGERLKLLDIKVPKESDQLFLALYLNAQNAYRAYNDVMDEKDSRKCPK